MTLSLLNTLGDMTLQTRNEWVAYFNSFQNPSDGLFYDPVIRNEVFDDLDCWGARHLALHMICAYNDLDSRPSYPFFF
jgi:hypothetical protein